MPRLAAEVYASYTDGVLKLARQKGGASRAQLMEELGISRSTADTMIERCGLSVCRKEGRVEFFSENGGDAAAPEPTPTPKANKPSVEEEEAEEEEEEEVEETPAAPAEPAPAEPAPAPAKVTKKQKTASTTEDAFATIAEYDAEIVDTRNALRDVIKKVNAATSEWLIHQAMVDTLQARLADLAAKRIQASSSL